MRSADKRPISPEPESGPSSKARAPEQILDLLLDALEQRQAARRQSEETSAHSAEPERLAARDSAEPLQNPIQVESGDPLPASPPEEPVVSVPPPVPDESSESSSSPDSTRTPPQVETERRRLAPLPGASPSRMLARLLLAVAALVVLVNIPVNRHGTPLARIMPDSAALVIRDGLVLKAAGPDIYVLQDDKLRWISSLEAFEYFGYGWPQVRVVDQSFLDKFEIGRPLHVLLKCGGSPHIYALENSRKRWIKDITTFEAEGFVWEDVMSVDCAYLSGLPDGLSIPEDADPPPQP